MNMIKKKILTAFILILGVGVLSGCNLKFTSNLNATTETPKISEINVGLVVKEDSCCTTDVDKQQGLQIELWEEIGKRLDYKIKFKSLEEEKIINALETGEIDTAVYKLPSEDVQKNFNLTLPIIDTSITSASQYPFKKDAKGNQLTEEVNKTLKSMNEDGTMKSLTGKWLVEN